MNVALFDTSTNDSYAELDVSALNKTKIYVGVQCYITSAQLAAQANEHDPIVFTSTGPQEGMIVWNDGTVQGFYTFTSAIGTFTPDTWHVVEQMWDLNAPDAALAIDALTDVDTQGGSPGDTHHLIDVGAAAGTPAASSGIYVARVKIGTGPGLGDILDEDWTSGDFTNWTATFGDCSIVAAPSDPPAFVSALVGPSPFFGGGRVGIAFDDGPLVADPTWTFLDDPDVFPAQFVAGYDTKNGRQTLISQTETGTATVYINDHELGLFDNRNLSSPYTGKLDGRQILLQLWNPVTETWEPQFRGLIDDWTYDIDGSAVDANGDPINASIQIECVDIFDYLNGYGLTPGIDGHYPVPTGMEDGVWYDPTSGALRDRFIAILDDAGLAPSRYHCFQGNVHVIGVKYDPDESALTALRDAADAELPFIANIYVDRYGRFLFRGRYSRFDPDSVAAEPGADWDFTRWPLGDGKAIEADPTRGQIRELSYARSRADLINAALAYPQDIKPADMPGQVYADGTSITNNGKHQAPPMSDLLTTTPTVSGYSKLVETGKFAELLVENKKHVRIALTRLVLKSMPPDDPRAAATWGAICGADISHIVNIDVGYPGGTGLTGDSPEDDFYIEGRSLTVRPLNPVHDYVECALETSPALWSMDANGVFPPFGGST